MFVLLLAAGEARLGLELDGDPRGEVKTVELSWRRDEQYAAGELCTSCPNDLGAGPRQLDAWFRQDQSDGDERRLSKHFFMRFEAVVAGSISLVAVASRHPRG